MVADKLPPLWKMQLVERLNGFICGCYFELLGSVHTDKGKIFYDAFTIEGRTNQCPTCGGYVWIKDTLHDH